MVHADYKLDSQDVIPARDSDAVLHHNHTNSASYPVGTGIFLLETEWLESEVDHSPTPDAEV
jgi:hypothetical protein